MLNYSNSHNFFSNIYIRLFSVIGTEDLNLWPIHQNGWVPKLKHAEIDSAVSLYRISPTSPNLASAVRLSLDYFAQEFPGNAVELRVPPFRVVQLLSGVTHKRGTPPAVVEISPETWIDLIDGIQKWADALQDGLINASGAQSDLATIIDSF